MKSLSPMLWIAFFTKTLLIIIVLADLAKYIVYDLVKHHNNGELNDSLIAISEDTAASAPCGSMVIARNKGTVSNIQIGKLTFPYVCMGGYLCVYNCFALS